MITIYTMSSRKSCRDAVAHLIHHGLPFIERKVHLQPLTMDELNELIDYTDGNACSILSENSKDYKTTEAELAEIDMTFDDLKISELHYIIKKHPRILKSPIITNGKFMMLGFSEEAMDTFLPRSTRRRSIDEKLETMRAIEDIKVKEGKEIGGGHWGREGGWHHEVFA